MGSRGRVLVTGSSRGIGKAIADELANRGWQVVRHASRPVDLPGESVFGDLSDPETPAKIVEQVGAIEALVNNAGIYIPSRFGSDEEAWQRQFAINLDAPRRLIAGFLPHFRQAGAGRVVNVASRVGFRGEAGAAAYAASKAALLNLTRSLSVELAPDNVRLFAIAPGWVDTSMAREGMSERLEEILKGLPLGRMASPQDCANAVAFFLQPESDYLSGQHLDINGASYFH